jgi:hypothetical protein
MQHSYVSALQAQHTLALKPSSQARQATCTSVDFSQTQTHEFNPKKGAIRLVAMATRLLTWTEQTSATGFQICTFTRSTKLSLSYIAFQGSFGTDTGVVNVLKDTKRTSHHGNVCVMVKLAQHFKEAPLVIGSMQSAKRSGVAVTYWVENIDTTKFQVCFRGVNGLVPAHASFTWFAFEKKSRVWPTDGMGVARNDHVSGRATAPKWGLHRTTRSSKLYVTCKTIQFAQGYNDVPTVLVTANHQVCHRMPRIVLVLAHSPPTHYFLYPSCSGF